VDGHHNRTGPPRGRARRAHRSDAAARWAPVPFDVDDLDGERLLAEATGALLSAGALNAALGRIAREAAY
jgi:hypothetical protein